MTSRSKSIKTSASSAAARPATLSIGHTPGIEVTTGPLGQGFANGVGFAHCRALLAARFNRPGHEIIDHYTYCLCSDGDMMEGISSEAASLAGTMGLGKLICLYDSNNVSLDGPTSLSFQRGRGRALSCLWVARAARRWERLDARRRGHWTPRRLEMTRPSLIVCTTHIGYGSPNKQDKSAAHGAALGEEEVRLAKEALRLAARPALLRPR